MNMFVALLSYREKVVINTSVAGRINEKEVKHNSVSDFKG